MKFTLEIDLTDFGDTWKTETKIKHDFGETGPEKYPRKIVDTLRETADEIEKRINQMLEASEVVA